MPYIPPDQRKKFGHLENLGNRIDNPGELNYVLTKIVKGYIDKCGVSYVVYNAVMGVLACMTQELYRRLISGYEDSKIQENGDVY